jgi:ribosomal protein S18 acetylase RimI-like enzyme
MRPADKGKFWKTPFVWEPDCPEPAAATLAFRPAAPVWLASALAEVMTASVDESDQHEVAELGSAGAAKALLELAYAEFDVRPKWWRSANRADGAPVGFVLPVLFRDEKTWRGEQPQGTIFYIGVLPRWRGRGYGAQLLAEATRVFAEANCWRAFCDTSSRNEAMVRAFRSAGYKERAPWQRPIASPGPMIREATPRSTRGAMAGPPSRVREQDARTLRDQSVRDGPAGPSCSVRPGIAAIARRIRGRRKCALGSWR